MLITLNETALAHKNSQLIKMESTIIFQSSNISFNWPNSSNLVLDKRICMESHIVGTNSSIEQYTDWSDVDENYGNR